MEHIFFTEILKGFWVTWNQPFPQGFFDIRQSVKAFSPKDGITDQVILAEALKCPCTYFEQFS